jgi:hypothetical protein
MTTMRGQPIVTIHLFLYGSIKTQVYVVIQEFSTLAGQFCAGRCSILLLINITNAVLP